MDKKRWAVVSGILVLALGVSWLWFHRELNYTIATVNKNPIKRAEYLRLLERRQGAKVLKEMIHQSAVLYWGEKEGIKILEEEITKEVEKISNQYPTQERFDAVLRQSVITMEELRRKSRVALILKKLSIKDVNIEEMAIRSYYEENKKKYFTHPEEIAARMILAKDKSKAAGIQMKLFEHVPFDKIAMEMSDDPDTRGKGGDLGWVKRGQLPPQWEDRAFSLKKGRLSDFIETADGFLILKVYDERGEIVQPYEEIRDQIEKTLTYKKARPLRELYEEILNKSEIQFKDEKYRKAFSQG